MPPNLLFRNILSNFTIIEKLVEIYNLYKSSSKFTVYRKIRQNLLFKENFVVIYYYYWYLLVLKNFV